MVTVEREMNTISTKSRPAEEKIWWNNQRNCIKMKKSMQSQVHEIYFPVNKFIIWSGNYFRWNDNTRLEFITYDIQQNSVAFNEVRAWVVVILNPATMHTDLKLRGGYWLTTLKRSIRLAPRYEWMVAPTVLPSIYFVLDVPITKSWNY